MGEDLFLQQNNAPPHHSQAYLAFLEEEEGLTILDWPAMLLDINIIENVRKVVKDRSPKASIDTLDELWTTMEIRVFWLSDDYIKNFSVSTSMLKAVLKSP